ncbi:9505_t:CDS:2 [Funneliformis caledonium]|uniref:9505_t:CDS:1 n=1 Tax=Funneliformis caledonium TaxID=1117310 RepID=A0A9N9DL53_9GLOM|nr:9505_t:CDS:2 [Funneliformis caledonium]
MTLSEEVLTQLVYREYWEKPYSEWEDVKTWDHLFIIKDNRDATDQLSHDALGKELKILIKNLKPETREIEKARAI